MEKIVSKTAGFKHIDNSWEIVKMSVKVDDRFKKIKWPPRVKYKDNYYILNEDTLDKSPMYIQEFMGKELITLEPETSTDEQIFQLQMFCEKQHTQIVELVLKVRELERELINERKRSNESKT